MEKEESAARSNVRAPFCHFSFSISPLFILFLFCVCPSGWTTATSPANKQTFWLEKHTTRPLEALGRDTMVALRHGAAPGSRFWNNTNTEASCTRATAALRT
jgi:hypothetical protein